MAGKVRTWVWILVAVAVVIVLSLVALAGLGFYFVSQHVESSATTPAGAAREFEAARAARGGQEPLIELDRDGRLVRTRTDREVPANAAAPAHLILLAFDPSEGRILRAQIPFWLLRLRAGSATFEMNGGRISLQDLKLTVPDLERYGPALVLDHQARDGGRILVWTE